MTGRDLAGALAELQGSKSVPSPGRPEPSVKLEGSAVIGDSHSPRSCSEAKTSHRRSRPRCYPISTYASAFLRVALRSMTCGSTACAGTTVHFSRRPLVVDQPQDNLDNRHIARSVCPVLLVDKRTRQIIMTSHNANLVVLSDPEGICIFDAEGGRGSLARAGFLSHRASEVTAHVLDILDGGERALEFRTKKYGTHP
jgi:hypothetical protein